MVGASVRYAVSAEYLAIVLVLPIFFNDQYCGNRILRVPMTDPPPLRVRSGMENSR